MARKLQPPRLSYVYAYAPPPDKEQFQRKVRNDVERENITCLGDDVLADLFVITIHAVSDKPAQKRQRTKAGRHGLELLARLVRTLQKHVDESLGVLAKYQGKKLPVNSTLIRPLRREFLELRKLLARVALDYRVNAELVKGLQKTPPIHVSREINEYLRVDVPELRTQNRRDVVIAACLLAAGIYSKKELADLVSAIPMQLYRAAKRAKPAKPSKPVDEHVKPVSVRRETRE